MMSFEDIAKATLKIECGNNSGSGFHFQKKNIVLTNFHVVKPNTSQSVKIFSKTELGNHTELELLAYSPENEFDYAILKTKEKLDEERVVLEPKCIIPTRGMSVCFSGFPHGINDLLVQTAYVSGPFDKVGFYIDGSVNGGNSGGPIIDMSDMKVIGVVTQRRYLTPIDLNQVNRNLEVIYKHFQQMGGRAGIIISGVDFGQFAQLISKSFNIFRNILEANANTGIGIGYRIEFVNQKLKEIENE
ncbi:MAG TPA: hypothetical protein DCP10_07845 [Bacteroidales bacterium]|nr:hypothetical protein [Bacteroidales bacterium]